ncbi:DUF3383 domain-containing protein [Pseudoteredinibacter isoporae]|uniref:Uncharacterized protein n=1 Tax=Pseudoteredinibacter isoporae TaxID=570281 RepID=A0A7X0MWV1_9GAMM|nr:DUF3383 domain-containing protein [Pseudoteredinibacter isoporae]MBB6522798.1 hypothetical protein [Pseudoteredinibacter isoporae]NHO88325.1 DUF3383 domain-containing protein [Pseudoteredinibacter isoporae]NIB23344.1 DUF3383 domain-containing protein [Pseudoteredinibacter isoporae]
MKKSVRQYLERYAEIETQILTNWPAEFQQAMLIPAKNEDPQLIERIQSFCERQTNTLLLLIINQAEGTAPSDTNTTLWQRGLNSGTTIWQQDHLKLIQWQNNSALLLIDRFSSGLQIPAKEGVGLARKIAADVLAKLINKGFISNPWIYSSDADCTWPENYFKKPTASHRNQLSGLGQVSDSSLNEKIVAAHFAFTHGPEQNERVLQDAQLNVQAATELYEQSLHYYRNGLSWAGSPYNFYTIGSCLAFRVDAYCEVRGFPCRAAGEDFYLLNKLAKLGHVCYLDSQLITIESRLSQRAPFGTGPAVTDILEKQLDEKNYPSYHPQCFADLKTLMENSADFIINQQGEETIRSALNALGVQKFRRHLELQNSKPEQFSREFHTWFDGFRTLKFVHYLRDHYYPSIPMAQGIQQLQQWQKSVTER